MTQCQGMRLVASGSLWSTRMPVFALMIGSCTSASILLNSPRASHVQHRLFLSSCYRPFRKETEYEADLEDVDKMRNLDVRQPSMETEKDVGLALREVQDLYKEGKYTEALQVSLGMKDWLERELGEDHPVYASCLNNVALMHKMTNELEDAVHYYAMALDTYERSVGVNHRSYATALNNLGLVFLMQAQQAEANKGGKMEALALFKSAEATLREVLVIRAQLLEDDDPALLTTRSNLASILQRTGRGVEAEEMVRTTISRVQEKARGKASPEVATAMNNLGYLLKQEGRLEESRALYKEALRIRRALYPKEHPLVIVSLNNLAELCLVTPGLEGEGGALQDEILKLLNPIRRDGDGSKSIGMTHEEKPN